MVPARNKIIIPALLRAAQKTNTDVEITIIQNKSGFWSMVFDAVKTPIFCRIMMAAISAAASAINEITSSIRL